MKYLYIYLAIINIIAAAVTVHDKNAAIRHSRRVSEKNLLILSALGGAPAMYLTMLTISHKTRKMKFMLGVPVIFVIELLAVFLVSRYGSGIIQL